MQQKQFIRILQSVPGVVESMKVVTDENAERVARYAFEYGNEYSDFLLIQKD